MGFSRSSGILLHPTSLPGRFGIGDLGTEAYEFVDFLADSAQSLWQVLPLNPPEYGNSPYQALSAFAGNPLLISPAHLVRDGLLSPADVNSYPQLNAERVDFGRVIESKNQILDRAYENFKTRQGERADDFSNFTGYAAAWLDDFALFAALKEANDDAPWNAWPAELARRDPAALAAALERLHDRIEAHKFFQYLFHRQWLELKAYCRERGVGIMGDMPIFVAHNSADVWTNQQLFKLDDSGYPTVVAGVPPDAFSETGQRWGNPVYNWEVMRAEGYLWWIDRMQAALRVADLVRIDHFRGFAATWEVPAGDDTAENGEWVEVPGRELFETLKDSFDELPIIAEDLGTITPDVIVLRDEFGFPGMRVLQFAFGSDTRDTHLPHNYVQNTVVYTGTHDNDTTVGWMNRSAGAGSTHDAEHIDREKGFALKYLNTDGREINWDFIRAALASVANIAIVPVQDILGLGSDARMNLPATEEGNWGWRMQGGSLTPEVSTRLKEMTELYGRATWQ